MKELVFPLVTVVLMASIVLVDCKSSAEKVKTAEDDLQGAASKLEQVKKDSGIAAVKAAEALEWKAFKGSTEIRIRENETRIGQLKKQMKSSGKKMDEAFEKRIESMEKQNKALIARMEDYPKNQGNWESFKMEFIRDLDGLGEALKNFTTNK